VDPCPVDAIYAEEDLPPEWNEWTAINQEYFTGDREEVRSRVAVKVAIPVQPV
jgi:hypothetical protein